MSPKDESVKLIKKTVLIIYAVMAVWILYIAFLYGKKYEGSTYNKRIALREDYIDKGEIRMSGGMVSGCEEAVLSVERSNLSYLLYTPFNEWSLIRNYIFGKKSKGADVVITLDGDYCRAIKERIGDETASFDILVTDVKSGAIRCYMSGEDSAKLDEGFEESTIYKRHKEISYIADKGEFRPLYIIEEVKYKDKNLFEHQKDDKLDICSEEEAELLKDSLLIDTLGDKKIRYKIYDDGISAYSNIQDRLVAVTIIVHDDKKDDIIESYMKKVAKDVLEVYAHETREI
jgi:hypothetical protein